MASSSVGGLSGAFIPVSEDEGMIRAVREGALSLDKLEAMTAVCSVGLDMVALPGDTPASSLVGIIADEMAMLDKGRMMMVDERAAFERLRDHPVERLDELGAHTRLGDDDFGQLILSRAQDLGHPLQCRTTLRGLHIRPRAVGKGAMGRLDCRAGVLAPLHKCCSRRRHSPDRSFSRSIAACPPARPDPLPARPARPSEAP